MLLVMLVISLYELGLAYSRICNQVKTSFRHGYGFLNVLATYVVQAITYKILGKLQIYLS